MKNPNAPPPYYFSKMVNKCVAFGCKSGYDDTKGESWESVATFRFPFSHLELLQEWIRFVSRKDWAPSSNSVICEKHFEERFVSRGKRCKLKWELNPIPSIHSPETLKRPSTLPTPTAKRKSPTERIYQNDELNSFRKDDEIGQLSDINKTHAPTGFKCNITEDHIVFFHLSYDEATGFPIILESIKIDKKLHVQLQYNGCPLPLPPWFIHGHNAKIIRFSMFSKFTQLYTKCRWRTR